MKQIDNYIGDWGRFQWYVYLLLFVCGFNAGIQSVIYSFTLATPEFRCKLYGDDNVYSANGSDAWLDYHHHKSDEDSHHQGQYCRYCNFTEIIPNKTECFYNESNSCDEGYLFDTSIYASTMATQYELVCTENAWKVDFAKSMYMVGVLIGSGLFGDIADRIGRKKVFCGTGLVLIVTANIVPLISNFWLFCIMQIINGGFVYGAFVTGFTIIMEMSNGYPRTIAGIFWQGYFAIGYIYVGVVAYFVRDWKHLMWIGSFPTIFSLPLFWLLPESFRWLAVKGRYEEAEVIIRKICSWNNVYIPEDVLKLELQTQPDTKQTSNASIVQLFTNGWPLRRTTLIVFFTWLSVSMCYYGLSLNASDMPGDVYVNFLLLGIIEFPGFALAILFMEKINRRFAMVIMMGTGGTLLIISSFLTSAWWKLIVTFAVIGKMCMAGAFAIIYNYSGEVFPTVVRNAGTGFSSVFARVGSMAAPQIHLLGIYSWKWLPMVLYGGFAVVASLLDLMLPETKGKVLPDTIEDGVNFHKSSKSNSNPKDEEEDTMFQDKTLKIGIRGEFTTSR